MIGIFDSGLGGLNILKKILNDHSEYNYIYLGDNANVPYGNKSPEIIYEYVKRAVDFFYSQGCKLIIIACNSASAQALRRVQQEYLPIKYPNLKILGVIRPVAEKIVEMEKIKKIGIIGTRATIKSNIYQEELEKLNSKIEIFQKATPLLVPLIEEGWSKKPETKMILKKYLRYFKVKQIDALVLACTHYPFLIFDIKRIMGKRCLILDPAEIVSDSLGDYLKRHKNFISSSNMKTTCRFYITDDNNNFKNLALRFMGGNINNLKKVVLK
jgi:glutamate racemase